MKKVTKLRIESLEKELKKLEKYFQDVDNKRIPESNPQEQNNLQLQLDNIAKRMEEIERQIQELSQQAEEDNIQRLLKILSELFSESKKEIAIEIQRAYRACSPEGWLYLTTDKLEEILADVEKMPKGNSKYTRVEHFVACLVAVIKISSEFFRQLKNWAEENINEFSELLNQEKQNLSVENRRRKNSYLLIVLDNSNQKSAHNNSDCYTVQAWIIPDIQLYNYETGVGCEQLTLPEFDDTTFAIDKIPKVLNRFLQESIKYCHININLTIEIFLPFALLNHAVDCWKLEDDLDLDLGFPTFIGQDYRVVVRSYERWTDAYNNRFRVLWKQKWETLQQVAEPSDCSTFLLCDDETVNDLFYDLREPDIIGLKVVKAPKKIGKESIFAAILKTAIPVALWLRQNPPGLDCQSEIEQILDCCIHHLPEAVTKKRKLAKPNADTVIGHHLSLLWEDPYRLPPSINYSM